ncbi:methyltransferase [Candidatus Magnetominusculus dajiuhuensis]|uniref:methyltransferase n=1 Tax=Candidatus Magnetominusculus dajiuhuensis TaxID=3137712 RepID=UPI003B437B9B
MEDISTLKGLIGGFRQSRILFTANNLRVFDFLNKPKSAKVISAKLGADLRAMSILLDALVSMGLIKKNGSLYENLPISSEYLQSGRPEYQGDIISHYDTLWNNWSGLDNVVKTGSPNRTAANHESFIRGMHNLSVMKAKSVIDFIDLSGMKTAIDIGGGPGTYTIELAGRGIDVTLFDRPDTIAIAKEYAGHLANVKFMEGDFLVDPIGKGYDLAFISQVFHSYTPGENLRLIKKVKKSLNKGGKIVIQEFFIEDNMSEPLEGALFAVNMLVHTEGGRCYSVKEMQSWLNKSGFTEVAISRLNEAVIISAET